MAEQQEDWTNEIHHVCYCGQDDIIDITQQTDRARKAMTSELKEAIFNELLGGKWEDLYGDLFSENGLVRKEEWDAFWKLKEEGGSNEENKI